VQYQDVAALWEDHPDAVIVTGTEPKLADLTQEPYWPKLIRTVDWCQDNVSSTIWSCLAAHAAVLHLDGIKRQPLEQKCFGIFPCERSARHPLLEGLAFPSLVQHSRWNALDPAQLRRAGYTVLTFSRSAGADIFVRKDKCLSVFFQGHPEYAEDTLLREYRRDVGRYLNRESDRYPALPEGCIGESDTAALLAFRDRALAERRPNSIADLPLPNAPAIPRQFHTQARRLYRNWLTILANQKASRPAFIEPRAPNAISRHSI
jgi:homoserine O-succinyltransferase